jgi:MFS transporter, DHA1 family, multidrug resistance protein
MYIDLHIDRGVSLVGGLSCLGIPGLFFLYYYGEKLRARSRFAE